MKYNSRDRLDMDINLITATSELLQIGRVGRTFKMLYDSTPVRIATTALRVPFAVREIKSDYSNFTNCSIDCNLVDQSEQENYDALDERFKNVIRFSKVLVTDDSVDFSDDSFYFDMFKPNKDFPRLVKICLPRDRNGNFDFTLFDKDKTQIRVTDANVQELFSNSPVIKAIIECKSIWVFKGRIGITWNLVQARFGSPKVVNSLPNVKPDFTQNLM